MNNNNTNTNTNSNNNSNSNNNNNSSSKRFYDGSSGGGRQATGRVDGERE